MQKSIEEITAKVDYAFSHRYNHTLHAYIDISEDLVAGTLLSQIMYWFSDDKNGNRKVKVYKEGYFWLAKGRNDWIDEIRISPKQYDNAIKKLKNKGFVETRLYKFNSVPTTHIRPVYEKINQKIKAWKENVAKEISGFDQMVNPDLPKGENGNLPKGEMDIDQTVNSITETTNNNYNTEDYSLKNTNNKASTNVEVNYKALSRTSGNKVADQLPYEYTQEQFDEFIKDKVSAIVDKSFPDNKEEIESMSNIISYFYEKYLDNMGERHPIMSDVVYLGVVKKLLNPIDAIWKSDERLNVLGYEAMIDRFFSTDYGEKSGNRTDYRIGYFFSDKVIENLFYRELY